jgi:glycosyltransferase involved in cell wall biosynthesis
VRFLRAGREPVLDVAFYMPGVGSTLAVGDVGAAGGAERQILMLAGGLARRGWRIAVVSYAADHQLPATVGGARLLVHRQPRRGGLLPDWIAYLWEVARMLFTLDAGAFVQRSAGSTTGYVGLVTAVLRRRFVYSSANVVDFRFEQLETNQRAVRLFHLGVRLAGAVVVQTPEQVELCRERFGREPVLIKSLAESKPLRVGMPEAFVWAGRLAAYKRPEVIVKLARALPEARFWMVGVATGEQEQGRLESLMDAARELANLEVLAPRPREELGELIARSVAVVNTAEYEGMPNVFLEGWARGVPALALSHDPDGVIARERLGSFAEGSLDRMIELARELWAGRGDQAELAQRCRAYIQREHSMDTALDRWEHVLRLGEGR